MHSRIIQLETLPVEDVGRIGPDDFCDHWFTYSIADYVDNDCDSEDTLNTLKAILGAYPEHVDFFEDDNGKGVIFHEGFTQAYFAGEYVAFRDALKALEAKSTLENFCNGEIAQAMYDLNSAYDDEYGFYIQSSDVGLKTFNRFLRYMKPDTKYYFGGTVDYHF